MCPDQPLATSTKIGARVIATVWINSNIWAWVKIRRLCVSGVAVVTLQKRELVVVELKSFLYSLSNLQHASLSIHV